VHGRRARSRRDAAAALGGAHAIAALAYGTATIPRVDKIVGPGNAYVAAAKALVSADCAIDFFAGPSEILIVVERPPAGSRPICSRRRSTTTTRAPMLVTPSRALARAVADESRGRCRRRPARDRHRAQRRHRRHASLDEAVALAERMAPEHLVCDADAIAKRLRRAGTVFVGHHSAQALGGLRHRLEPRPADERRRPRPRRPQRRRFRPRRDRAAGDGRGVAPPGAGGGRARRR
jgi:histidinol dehydrogenase